jgi:hypothetical protein
MTRRALKSSANSDVPVPFDFESVRVPRLATPKGAPSKAFRGLKAAEAEKQSRNVV